MYVRGGEELNVPTVTRRGASLLQSIKFEKLCNGSNTLLLKKSRTEVAYFTFLKILHRFLTSPCASERMPEVPVNFKMLPSGNHVRVIYTPLNPTFIQKNWGMQG